MRKTLRKGNGQFNGSVGSGAKATPKAAPITGPTQPASAGTVGVKPTFPAANPTGKPEHCPDCGAFINPAAACTRCLVTVQVGLVAGDGFLDWETADEYLATDAYREHVDVIFAGCDEIYREMTADRSSDPQVLDALAHDPAQHVRRCVAYNSQTPPHVLEALLGDTEPWVRAAAARHTATPLPALLAAIPAETNQGVFAAMAGNHNIPTSALLDIPVDDEFPGAALRMSERRDAPAETLARIAAGRDKHAKLNVAWHRNVTPDILEKLSRDKVSAVRARVAENSGHVKTPEPVLRRLATDKALKVRHQAQFALGLPLSVRRDDP